MAVCNANKPVRRLFVGSKPVQAVYAGSTKVWPDDPNDWVRDWRPTSDWYRPGSTCNAAGLNGAYDCDGTYSVTYWNEGQDQSYCYPDMSGSTDTRTLWRVGPVAHREQVDGQCGYSPKSYQLDFSTIEWTLGQYSINEIDHIRVADGTLDITARRNYADSQNEVSLEIFGIKLIHPKGEEEFIAANSLSFQQLSRPIPTKSNCTLYMYQRMNNAILSFLRDNTMHPASYSATIEIAHTTGAKILLHVWVSFNGPDGGLLSVTDAVEDSASVGKK